MQKIIYIHGLESSGKGFKGQLFRKVLPECLTPDFEKYNPKISSKVLLEKRMNQLKAIINDISPWTIIGSSFGGLMGALFTCQNPKIISKLILLAPYLTTSELNPKNYSLINVPVIAFHGINDKIVSAKRARARAEKLFANLKYNIVNDDHLLQNTVSNIDWKNLIKNSRSD